jgi:hypothetical protein
MNKRFVRSSQLCTAQRTHIHRVIHIHTHIHRVIHIHIHSNNTYDGNGYDGNGQSYDGPINRKRTATVPIHRNRKRTATVPIVTDS